METPEFYKTILDKMPGIVYINQIDDLNDFTTAKNIYRNQEALNVFSYSPNEIEEKKDQFFEDIIHPDDLHVASDSINYMDMKEGDAYGALQRLKMPTGEYHWYYGWCRVFQFKDGRPWQFICVAIDITEPMQSDKQLVALLKENNCLKNQLAICYLSKREKEVAKLIAEGKKDREISNDLFISLKTASTHRNNIIRKLKLRNTADLVRFVMENNLC